MMIGAPGQTAARLAADVAFIARFRPHMIGIGPFVPQHDTPLRPRAGRQRAHDAAADLGPAAARAPGPDPRNHGPGDPSIRRDGSAAFWPAQTW